MNVMKGRTLLLILLLARLSALSQDARFPDISKFHKPPDNPVLSADSSFTFRDPFSLKEVRWQRADVFNPAAILRAGKVYLLYRAEDNPAAAIGGRTSRIGLAVSADGIHFHKYPAPVLYPGHDRFARYDHPGGCEDPRVVRSPEGSYVMTYTAWNDTTARLSIAISPDLVHWKKQGPAFANAYKGKFLNLWSKSGSIIAELREGVMTARKINGKYWMYWGEQFINLAWSTNLRDWYPLLDSHGNLLAIARPRAGKFDSELTECGPPALFTTAGILLMYNGKNAMDGKADPALPRGTYSTGEIIFDARDPGKVINRSDTSFLRPSLPHELTGQYKAGTTFAEGLVYFQGKWFLYYGTADSYVGVTVTP